MTQMLKPVASRRVARGLSAVTAAGLIAALAACAPPAPENTEGPAVFDVSTEEGMADLIAAAQAEGELNLYTGLSEAQSSAFAEAFKEEYGITVSVTRDTSPLVAQRLANEQTIGDHIADVLVASVPQFFNNNPYWFVAQDDALVAARADVPDLYTQDYHYVLSLSPLGAQYNTDAVSASQAPKVWDDVLDGRFAGQVVINDPRTSDNYAGWADSIAEAKGIEYLEAVADLSPSVVASGSAGAQDVAAGKYELNFPTVPSFSVPLKAQGAPIEFVALSEPSLAVEMDAGMTADAPHPAAAQLFLNWLLTEAATEVMCNSTVTSSPIDPAGGLGCFPQAEGTVGVTYGLRDARLNELFDALQLP